MTRKCGDMSDPELEHMLIGLVILVVVIIVGTVYSISQEEKQQYEDNYKHNILIAQGIASKQIIQSTNYTDKINIVVSACEFAFGNDYGRKDCNKDLLKLHT